MSDVEQPLSLVDRFGRQVTYLRISVTDRCDLRCVYCMSEDMTFLPRTDILSLEEIYSVASQFVALGVTKIRITGGEPLVRNNIVSLLRRLSSLPGLHELVLTTNGMQLEKYAKALVAAGVKRINISLDSLRPDRFREMTRVGQLDRVLAGIDAAKDAGFQRIKLNAVVLKGRNDDEVLSLVEFASSNGLDISFIEEMPLGQIHEHSRSAAHVSSSDLLQQIRNRYRLLASAKDTGGPSRYYQLSHSGTLVGFISPHSQNFCASCNRVRLTAEGRLLLCLGNEHSLSVRDIIRQHPNNSQRLRDALLMSMQRKPKSHTFTLDDEVQVVRFMNMTGG